MYLRIWYEWQYPLSLIFIMKKILFIVFAFAILAGSSFALFPGLFPDTVTFPRVPSTDGTIGKVFTKILWFANLATYGGDGTVVNSQSLSWTSASWYLKDDASCPGLQRYIGIDADGKRLCGITPTLLTDYGTVQNQDCPADYYRIDNTQWTTSTGDVLKAWDIIKTPPGCTMTIVFSDFSLIRLDGDTTISLDLGTLADGSTIASAILSNGSIWWRILTETWSYNVWTDVIVVWVRWTSLAITSTWNTLLITNTGSGWWITKVPGISQTFVNLVDSRFSSDALIKCKNKITHIFQDLSDLRVGDTYALDPLWCEPITPTSVSVAKNINFSNSWIRKNIRKDVLYMYWIRSLSWAALSITKNNLIRDEIIASTPNVTSTGALTVSGSLEALNICEPWNRWWNEREGCQDNPIIAIADFTRPIPLMPWTASMEFYGSASSTNLPTTQPAWTFTPDPGLGIMITSTGYISYPHLSLSGVIWGFSWKTIIIETEPTAVWVKVLVNFWAAKYAKTDGTCFITGWTCTVVDMSGGARTKWKIEIINGVLSDLKIWSNWASNWIEARIKRILIQ